MLDERKTAILSAVVQEYIATALPVGSSHVVDTPGVSRCRRPPCATRWPCSSRRDTSCSRTPSAGRIPTDKGYRFFVDHLSRPGRLDPRATAAGAAVLLHAHGHSRRCSTAPAELLARLTNYAGVVVGPTAQVQLVRSMQLVRLTSEVATVVAVLGDGPSRARPSTSLPN